MKRFCVPLTHDDLNAIADCLCNGGIILMLTDTVYGVAAHVHRADAYQRIVSMKGRNPANPIPLLASSAEDAGAAGFVFSTRARTVANRFWPGALTLILETAEGGTEGVRVPDNETARAICYTAGGLLRCTSANVSGDPPACDATAATTAIPDADILVDSGPVKGGVASTVVQITDTSVRFFRVGGISKTDILACAGPVQQAL